MGGTGLKITLQMSPLTRIELNATLFVTIVEFSKKENEFV